jgi:hypothetical protein
VRPLAFDVEIPEDATAVQVWFRNFDGNGTCEDFDNASGANHQFDIEPAGAGPDAATLTLPLEVAVEGDLVPGGSLQIEYDLERLTTCRATHNGSPFWDITAHALFTPGNQQVEGSVREITLEGSPPAQVVRPLAFEVEIPEDATAVQVWFRNFDGNGTCEDFDSANGQNHRFQVE